MNETQLEKLKKIELNMFKEVINICEEHKLMYYVLGGTALGTVRHGGFIPWDDDIDVGMPRKDYECFLKIAQKKLPSYYFLQSPGTEKEHMLGFSKIRDSRTTFVETSVCNRNINHGVYIDIFPLDYYPEKKISQRVLEYRSTPYTIWISQFFYGHNFHNRGRIKKILFAILDYCMKIRCKNVHVALLKRDNLYKNTKDSSMIANYYGAWGKKEITPISWFDEGVMLEFEGLKVRVPKEYDKYLSQMYGNYMQFPPIEKRVSHHFTEIIDLDRSYSDYVGGNIQK